MHVLYSWNVVILGEGQFGIDEWFGNMVCFYYFFLRFYIVSIFTLYWNKF